MKNLSTVLFLVFIFFYHSISAKEERNTDDKNFVCQRIYIPNEDVQSASCIYNVLMGLYRNPQGYLFQDQQRVVGVPDANQACSTARLNAFNYCQYILWQRFGGYGYCQDYHYRCVVRSHLN